VDDFAWLVEEFRQDGTTTGRYMACQVALTITADPLKAKRFKRSRSAELRAAEMPRDALLGTEWRAVEHGFDAKTRRPQDDEAFDAEDQDAP